MPLLLISGLITQGIPITEIAFLKTTVPIIYISDGTFASCLNYHDSFKNLTKRSIAEGNFIEQQAIQKSKFVIVSSDWAKTSVINDYKADAAKVKTLPSLSHTHTRPRCLQVAPCHGR